MEGIKRGKSMVRPRQKDGPFSQVHTEGMPLEREQPAHSNWLQDGGLGEDNLYYLCCTKVAACKFQSRAQNIKTHEASQLHQRAALNGKRFRTGGVCCKDSRQQLHSSQEWLSAKERRGIR